MAFGISRRASGTYLECEHGNLWKTFCCNFPKAVICIICKHSNSHLLQVWTLLGFGWSSAIDNKSPVNPRTKTKEKDNWSSARFLISPCFKAQVVQPGCLADILLACLLISLSVLWSPMNPQDRRPKIWLQMQQKIKRQGPWYTWGIYQR